MLYIFCLFVVFHQKKIGFETSFKLSSFENSLNEIEKLDILKH